MIDWRQPSGPHRVGLIEFDLVDRRRAAMYASPPKPERHIKVMAWYPAQQHAGSRVRRYFEEGEGFGDIVSAALQQGPGGLDFLHRLETASHVDAPPQAGAFPLVVFTHGGMSYPQQNMLLMEHLASHGYVVVAPAHPHESQSHRLTSGVDVPQHPDIWTEPAKLQAGPAYYGMYYGGAPLAERLAGAKPMIANARQTWFSRLGQEWMWDNLFVVDALHAREVPEGARALADMIDFDRLSYIGMSFGGHVSALSCLNDPRARAGVNMDGGFFTSELLGRELGTPILALCEDIQLAGGKVGLSVELSASGPSMLDLLYERIDGTAPAAPVYRMSVRGATHHDFTDIPFLLREPAQLGGLLGDLGPDLAIDIQNETVRAFLDAFIGSGGQFPGDLTQRFRDRLVTHDRLALLAAEKAAHQRAVAGD